MHRPLYYTVCNEIQLLITIRAYASLAVTLLLFTITFSCLPILLHPRSILALKMNQRVEVEFSKDPARIDLRWIKMIPPPEILPHSRGTLHRSYV